MHFIKPVDVTDAILTSSNVAEADATEWDGTGSLPDGTVRMVTTTSNGASIATHGIYTLKSGGNSSVDPTGTSGSANWDFTSYTNRFKMFDSVVQSQTVFNGGIDVEVTPGQYTNSIALINVDAASVDIVMTSVADGEVYNETYSLTNYSGITDWYAYYFTPIERMSRFIASDLPSYSDATIAVSINDTGDAKCGELVLGNQFVIGRSIAGASLGIIDYSQKTTSESGQISVTEGPYARRSDFDVLCETSRTAYINDTLASIRATPVVWVGHEANTATIAYGYFREFNTILSDYKNSFVSLNIEGLT